MEAKHPPCKEEELETETVKPKDEFQDLMISVSLTRTYVIPDEGLLKSLALIFTTSKDLRPMRKKKYE